MAHELQERYSDMVLAKMRAELVLKDGIVFNNDYEGSPTAGAVKIPVRDVEVQVSDYDKANGINANTSSTTYKTLVINKDKAVSEIIDGYDAEAVPDGIVAERLDSAGYSMTQTMDTDGGSTLLAEGTTYNATTIDVSNAYDTIVDIRTKMSKANVPKDNRYLLATPDFYALLLKDKDHFADGSALSDQIKQTGAVGKIAGFTVYEWNDSTANLQFVCGHPKYATRVNEWSVPVKLEDMKDGKHIGASWINGRQVYAHTVTRPQAIYSIYSPSSLQVDIIKGTLNKKAIIVPKASGKEGTTYAYKVNPSIRATYGQYSKDYAGKILEINITEIPVSVGDILEIANFVDDKIVAVTYVSITANHLA
ncbi:MAG: hypothetical protein ACI4WH_05575 [Oscillospiraceae bacterium]